MKTENINKIIILQKLTYFAIIDTQYLIKTSGFPDNDYFYEHQ